MLTNEEVLSYYNDISQHFVYKLGKIVNMWDKLGEANLIIGNAHRLIAVCEQSATMQSLSGFNTQMSFTFWPPQIKSRPNIEFNKNDAWMYKISQKENIWAVDLNFNTLDEVKDLILMNQKAVALDVIHDRISRYRWQITKNEIGSQNQNHVYMLKYLEAKEIIEKNVQSDELLQYPFIFGYAKIREIDIQQAAKEVIIKHEMQCGFLAESENIRMTYTKKVINEKNIMSLPKILEDFHTQNLIYGTSL